MKKIIFQHHKQTNYISQSNSLWSHQWQRKDVACPVTIQYSFKTYTYHKQLSFGGQLPFVQQKSQKVLLVVPNCSAKLLYFFGICNYLRIYFVIRYCYIGVVFITITFFSKVSPPLFYWTIYFLLGRIVWDFFNFIVRRTDNFLITTALRGIRRENSKLWLYQRRERKPLIALGHSFWQIRQYHYVCDCNIKIEKIYA